MRTLLFCIGAWTLISLPGFAQDFIKDKVGYKLTQITPGSIYEKLGLKAGDILKTYDGKPFKNEGDIQELAHRFVTPGDLHLQIFRDGKLKELNYKIK